ncbi:hypothetical protein [Pseudomonas fluorescens]|uniref:hypothetical protein n=1 Tax=Pseudomonas fluorescens TaxID=294 RepID=UPI003D1D95EF
MTDDELVPAYMAMAAENERLLKIINSQSHSTFKIEAWPVSQYPAVTTVPVDGLKAFANELINGSLEGGSFDGGDIQDIAVKHGLLRIESRDKECGEICACREFGFPAECYRKTDLIANTPQ